VKVEISLDEITGVDFVGIVEGFYGQYDDIYIDGDRRTLVIVNPKPKLLNALKKRNRVRNSF